MEQALKSLQTFGIPAEDIQTSNMSVYQNKDTYYENDRQKTRPGQWQVSNSVNIKLRDIDRAEELSTLLVESGLNNISGSNFMMDESNQASNELTAKAVDNARTKAEALAKSQGLMLGEVISITDGVAMQIAPISSREFSGLGGGGGGPVAPGSSSVSTSVVVTFELN